MDRHVKVEFPSLKACYKCVEFDECMQKQCIQVYDALLKLKHYEDLELKLQEVYGECEGLLEESIKCLVEHEKLDIDKPIKARLLTDGSVGMLEEYKKIGTVEECWEARKKQMAKKFVNCDECGNKSASDRCPVCFESVSGEYCEYCGQHLDWSKS